MKKNVAIIGANKDGLAILPHLARDSDTNIVAIIDTNPQAMLYKLKELGYSLNPELNIKEITHINAIESIGKIDVVIDAIEDFRSKHILDNEKFKTVEKLGTLSAKLLWDVKSNEAQGVNDKNNSHDPQAHLLTSLHDIVDAVKLTNDRRELLNVLLNLATESTRAERGSIMLLDKKDNLLKVETAKGIDEEVARTIQVKIGEGISGKVAQSGEPLLISGKAQDEDFKSLRSRHDVKSALCVPLIAGKETIGVINVNSSASHHAFTQIDLQYLTTLSGFAAEVIKRSSEMEEMRIDAAKFSFWKEIETVMTSQTTFPQKLISLSRKIAKIIPNLTGYMYIYDSDRKKAYLKASTIKDTKMMGPLSISHGEGIEGSVLNTLEPCILVDRSSTSNFKRIHMTLPMIAKDNALIGLFVGHIISPSGLSHYHENFLNEMIPLIAEKIHELKIKEENADYSRKMIAVDEMGLGIITIKDQAKAAQVTATALAQLIDAEGITVRLKNGSNNFHLVASFGIDDIDTRDHFTPIEREAIGEVVRKKDLILRDFSEEASSYVRGIAICPLIINSIVVGTITALNKTDMESFNTFGGFSAHDGEILKRFVIYLEKSLIENNSESLKEITPKDPVTKPVEHDSNLVGYSHFKSTVDEEIERARRFDRNLVLAVIKLGKEEFVSKFVTFVKDKVRNFDVITLIDETTLGILFVESDEKVIRVLETLIDAANIYDFTDDIFFGYGVYPQDGRDFDKLLSSAKSNAQVRYITPANTQKTSA